MATSDDSRIPLNDSGHPDAILPPELRRFCWAGFWASWIWALGNGVWSGILGIVPCIGFVVRFFLGAQGNEWAWRNKKWESVEQFRRVQKEQAWAGFWLSIFSWLFLTVTIYPIFGRAADGPTPSHICVSHLKIISLGWRQYSQDYDGKLPPGKTMQSWKVAILPYLKSNEIFVCPAASEEISYAINRKIAGANLDLIENPSLIPVIFDSESRHLGGRNVAFADGRIKWFSEADWNSKILPRIKAFVPDKNPSR